MNYFGLFFTFTLVGVAIGSLVTMTAYETKKKSRRTAMRQAQRSNLYIHTLSKDMKKVK